MAVTVSSDLSVRLSADQNVTKLTEKQEVLRKSITKGEPKSIGISQVTLGFMIICYSVPLLYAELTEVLTFGVPWWSGVAFIFAGAIALVMEKRNTTVLFFACLVVSVAAMFISFIALIIYIVDIVKHPISTCNGTHDSCYHDNSLTVQMKSILLFLNVVQMSISTAFSFVLYKERQQFNHYLLVN